MTASLGAALGHRVGLALPATGCTSGRGDRQGLGRGLPSLLP
uniref:Solute carrier family 11 member 1 n=1 Tax=Homo sapiens TaxID=9606 RepID=A0A087X181_HUMAN